MSEVQLKAGDRVIFYDSDDGHEGPGVIERLDVCAFAGTLYDFSVHVRDEAGRVRFISKFNGDRLTLQEQTPDKSEHQQRKDRPIMRGVLDYFPDALMGVAEVSRIGNEQHNAGQPMHWAYGKSMDHADCCVRHLLDRGTLDADGASHTAKAAWRALAAYQTELEAANPELHARRQAQREAAAKGER